jgi:ferrous iron transport protein B
MNPLPQRPAQVNPDLPANVMSGNRVIGGGSIAKPFKAVLAGNPNVGKTVLYNAMARARQATGNYPGVTLEQSEGQVQLGPSSFALVDLPGIYTLAEDSPEGCVVRKALNHEDAAVVINVTDATRLERNLYLTAELLELGVPVVIALNFWDLALNQGLKIDCTLLSRLLGAPVIPTIGRTGEGVQLLLASVAQASQWRARESFQAINRLQQYIERDRDEETALSRAGRRCDHVRRICALVVAQAATDVVSRSERIDRVLMGRWLGLPIFALIIFLVFQLTFTVAQPMVGGMEAGFDWLRDVVSSCWGKESESVFRSLLVDGIIGGVGGVAVFLPNLLLLFLCLALLEQSGYMVRAMFILDRSLHRIGLPGKSFIPMLIGFGCTVPAVLATRTLATREDRLTTILVLPLISCSARLPIYTLIIAGFFAPRYQAPILWAVYATGIMMAIAGAKLLRFSFLQGASPPFIMELPPYCVPALQDILRLVWDRIWSFLRNAGTIILGISILFWASSVWPELPADQLDRFAQQRAALQARPGLGTEETERLLEELDATVARRRLEHSAIGRVGQALAPVFQPLGFDWKLTTALLGTLAAREVFLAQMAVIHAVGNVAGQPQTLRDALRQNYTPLQGICLMLFCMLGPPCLATFAVTRQETQSWKWPLLQLGGLTALAYAVTLLVYQWGRLFLEPGA